VPHTAPYHGFFLLLKPPPETKSVFLKLYKSHLTDSAYRLVSSVVKGKAKAAPEHNFFRSGVFPLNEEGRGGRRRWVLHY